MFHIFCNSFMLPELTDTIKKDSLLSFLQCFSNKGVGRCDEINDKTPLNWLLVGRHEWREVTSTPTGAVPVEARAQKHRHNIGASPRLDGII
jgi:hypothetical protein